MLTKAEFTQRLKNACLSVIAAETELTEIDAKFGDADCILCEARKLFDVCQKLYAIEENCVINREVIPESWWKR